MLVSLVWKIVNIASKYCQVSSLLCFGSPTVRNVLVTQTAFMAKDKHPFILSKRGVMVFPNKHLFTLSHA